MKVLHIIDHMGLGGAQAALLDLLEARAPDVDASLWTLRDRDLPSVAERLDRAGVRRGSLGVRRTWPFGILGLRARIGAEAPDIVHTHLEFSNILAVASALALGRRRPAIIQHVDNDPRTAYGRSVRAASRLLARQADLLIVVSESLRGAVDEAYGGRARRVEVVPPGIDLRRFDPARADAAEAGRLRRGARRVVGAVGRLAEQKAFHVLLEAMPRLLKAEPDTRLLLAGDGPLRVQLESLSRRLGVEDRVSFLGCREDTPSVYAAMDVFALPSRHEGYGIVFIEAMAMGVPVVGTRVVGSVDAVEDGVTGLLVPPGDPEALSRAILSLFEDQELRRRICGLAGAVAQERGSREVMAARTEALYRELLAERARRRK